MNLNKIKDIVKSCLEDDVSARSSDWILYKDVCKKLKIPIDKISVETMCENHNELQFPSFESVRRSRQKIQEMGDFRPAESVQVLRKKQEDEYYKEFRNVCRY